jgi:two-component sensor histidine kinase
LEQENARLRLALRELRHRSYNQWQLLIGLAEMESMQRLQATALGCSVRLCTLAYAFVTLNRALDTNLEFLIGSRKVGVRDTLENILRLLQAVTEEGGLSFAVQDAWLSEKGCTALLLICAELVCNAMKYGKKTIQVTLRIQGQQGILEVCDDGPGFPKGFCIQEQRRQGLQLVEALCRFDLEGEIRCHNEAQGAVVTLAFPVLSAPGVGAVEAYEDFCSMEGVVCFDKLGLHITEGQGNHESDST